MLNRITRGIIIASLLLHPQVNTVEAFAIEYKDTVNDIKVINNINNENINICINQGYNNLDLKIEQYKQIQDKVNSRIDNIIRKQEEQARIEEEKKNSYDIELIFSFYTDLAEENGGHMGITCTGDKLQYGYLASNVWKLGTKFETEQGEIFTIADKGGSHFNSYNRVDAYIPRNQGETTSQYKKRVLNMGHKTVKVRIIKE